MATLSISDIAIGEIEFLRRRYPIGKFMVNSGVTVSEGDLIDIIGNYTTSGGTSSTSIFKGRIIDTNFEKVKTITTEAEAEEMDKIRPQGRYSGTLGGLIQDLEREWFHFLSMDLNASSPYMYRSPHNFSGVTNGNFPPSKWDFSFGGGAPYHGYVIADTLGHQKVLELYSNNATGWCGARYEWEFDTSETYNVNIADMDVWVATNSAAKAFRIEFKNFYHDPVYDGIIIKFDDDGKIKYRTSDSPYSYTDTGETYSANTMYRITLRVNGDTDLFDLDINGVNILSEIAIWGNVDAYPISGLHILLETAYTDHYVWIDAPGFDNEILSFEQNYVLGTNQYYQYDELNYDTEVMKYILGGDMTLLQFLNMYADQYLYTWYLKPDYELIFNNGAVDSGVDISTNVRNVDGKKQIKNFDKVILLGGFVENSQLEASFGAGNIIVKDTYANITNYDALLALAQEIYNQKTGNPKSVALDYLNIAQGYIQVGEEVTIVGNTLRFSRSDDYIVTSNTQFKIKGVKVHIIDGQINYIELFLDDVLVFQVRGAEEDLPNQNSALITQVGTGTSAGGTPSGGGGGGEANTMANVGVGGVGIFKQKAGIQFQMKNINIGSSKLSIFNDAANNEVDLDLVEGNIVHNNTSGGTANDAHHAQAHALQTSGNPHSGSLPLADLAAGSRGGMIRRGATDWEQLLKGTNGYYLKAGATDISWANPILDVTYGVNWDNKLDQAPSADKAYEKFVSVDNNISALQACLLYKGVWDADTAYPSSPDTGDYWIVNDAGDATGIYYAIGDWIVYNGASWDKITKFSGKVSYSVDVDTSIQLAVNTVLAAGGGVVILEPGRHGDEDSFPITINNTNNPSSYPIAIIGSSETSIIDTNGNYTVFDIDKADFVWLGDFKIDASDITTSTKYIIDINEVGDHKIVISNLNITGDGGQDGIGVFIASNYVEVISCIFNNIYHGIRVNGGSSCIFIENYATLCDSFAIHSMAGGNQMILGNIIKSCGHGIQVSGSYHTITNNNIYDSGFGIYLEGASYSAVGNNVVYSGDNNGIYLVDNSDRNSISGNISYNNQTGINIQSGCDNNVVGANMLYNNSGGDYLDFGAGNIKLGDNTAFASSWNGDLGTPTKNTIYDEFIGAMRDKHYILLQDRKFNGTNAGASSSATWHTRVLNQEVRDQGGHCSLSSNRFTLAAGTYIIKASAPCYIGNNHALRLRDVTGTPTTILNGTAEYANSTHAVANRSFLNGVFTIAAGQALELQHYITTAAALGLGPACNNTEVEVYAEVELWKIA